jgi:hypothetical protein
MTAEKNNAAIEAAEKILRDNVGSWPEERPNHQVSWEELLILIQAGAELKKSKDNQDGTFFYEIEYKGKAFVTNSQNKIVPS